MPAPRAWALTLGAVLVGVTIFAVLGKRLGPSAEALLPATRSPWAAAKQNAPFATKLSREGLVESPGMPEAMGIAVGRAKGLFRETRWDEFIATAEQLDSAGRWTVRIAPKSGERDDMISLTVENNHVTSFGFHRRDKLKGYTGRSKKGASPGYCR
jgi:hypothetical protein